LNISSRERARLEDAGFVLRQVMDRMFGGCRDGTPEREELGVDMHWYFAELPPQKLLSQLRGRPDPDLITSWAKTARSWRLDVSVEALYYPWITPGRDRVLRKVRSVLEEFAKPRLILPETNERQFRDDYIALTLLFAAKAQCLARNGDEPPRFF